MYEWRTINAVLNQIQAETEAQTVAGLAEVRQRGNLAFLETVRQTLRQTLPSAQNATGVAGTPSETPTADPSPSCATAEPVAQLTVVFTNGAEIVGLNELPKQARRQQPVALELEDADALSVTASYSEDGIEIGAVVSACRARLVLGYPRE